MKSLTALLAVVTALCLCGIAVATASADGSTVVASPPAQQDLRAPDQVAPAATAFQDLRAPDRTASGVARQDLRAPDRTTYAGSLAPESVAGAGSAVASSDAIPTSGGGLSALWIVLISLGGALALAGVAYTTMRVVHAHGPAAS